MKLLIRATIAITLFLTGVGAIPALVLLYLWRIEDQNEVLAFKQKLKAKK